MVRSLGKLFAAATLLILTASTVQAQTGSGTSTLSGIVADSAGGVVPGATVVVTNSATGVKRSFITNSAGAFSAPALDIGTYSVNVSLQGFKTAVVNNLVLEVGSPRAISVTLEVGALTETVEVRAGSELIQTQSTAISATINATQIQNLPLTSRNALFGFVIMLPGVDTPGNPRDSQMFGLPEQAINITIDGINTNNNFQRGTDGFYSMVFPQLDAVEQVTVTGAAAGADSAGGGSVAIRFVTRSGTNAFRGTAYYYLRHPNFNTNYYFNELNKLPKNRLILNQGGASAGGPIVIPKVYDGRGKAFYFFNYEEFYQPTSATRTRTLLHPTTASGIYRYNVTSGGVTTVREVDLFQLAANRGQIATWDPTVQALLSQVRSLSEATVSAGTGKINDRPANANQQELVYLAPGYYVNHLPTGKVDFNLSSQHRLSGSYWWQNISRFPDIQNGGEATFPGLPNKANYRSIRTVGSTSLRSTFSSALVNELVAGWQWGPGTFNADVVASQFDNQQGFSIPFPFSTSATRSTNPNTRYQSNWSITDTVNWLKGSHTISFGGSFSQVIQRNTQQNVVPSVGFGIQSGLDPADSMFSTSNFQGASNTNLNEARALYAFITGRVTSVNAQARQDAQTNRYVYLGREEIRGTIDEWSAFFQDSWRMKPTFTVNYGLAYLAQMPMRAGNDVYSTTDYAGFCGPYGIGADGQCKLFQVGGEQTGVHPQFVQYTSSTPGYNTDWNNIAPNVGVAWRPNVQAGWLRKVLGDPEQATVRAGFSMTFDKPSMGDFTGLYGGNPGRNYNANRNNTTGATHLLVSPGESWPVLFRDPSRLGPPSGIPDGPVYPILATTGTSLAIFDPNLEVPFTRSFSAGFQRAVTRDMAFEMRYVGTRGKKAWVDENWNERNVVENGFFEEFKLAQQNLRSHVLAGCGGSGNPCSFAYRGAGTNPLPILLAYLNAQPFGNAGNQALYTGTAWTNTTLTGRLSLFEPQPFDLAADLETTARMANALNAGLPSNFFRMNPAIGTNGATITTSVGESRYDSLVLELRRRYSRGLLLTTSYTRAWRWGQFRDSLHFPRQFVMSTNSVPHALKITSNWDLPVGRGKRFGTDFNPWMEGILGNWTFNLIGRVQAGRVLTVTGARLVGMTVDELQDMYKIRIKPDGTVFMLPDDVILNTRRAYDSSSTTASGYGDLGAPEGKYIAPASDGNCIQLYAGDCAARNIFLHGPIFTRFDMSWKKTFPFSQRANFMLEIDVLNIFDNINFNPVFNPGSGNIFNVGSAYTDISGTYDPGGRLGQVVWRVNW